MPSMIVEVMLSRSAVVIRSRTNRTRCRLGTAIRPSAAGDRAAPTRSVGLPLDADLVTAPRCGIEVQMRLQDVGRQ